MGAGGGQVGGDEEVVGLDTVGVTDGDQADRVVLVDVVPQDVTDQDQPLDSSATDVDLDVVPVVGWGRVGEFGWGG